MKKYRVVWTEMALRAIESIIDRFPDEDHNHAQKILNGLLAAGDSLETASMRGRHVPELRGLGGANLREIFYKPWRIIYETCAKRVETLLVLDGRSEAEELLADLLIQP